ncbi:protein-export chaperone SecB [Shouchella miscanthi]|uniref:protein-export chaperone SecB n=1 Tax=Shouchella miscanthi TaxID=2598861 RepID=UPI0011A59DAB|nr:protein-export chaperone SecB [Shouchella miscanthi]
MTLDKSVYDNLINVVQFRDIELLNLEMKRYVVDDHDRLTVDFHARVEDLISEEDMLIVNLFFEVKAEDEKNNNDIFLIKFNYKATYNIPIEEDFEDQYLSHFAKINAPINIWPYARELISSTTVRMGYPALYVPLHKDDPIFEENN